jgi:rSAM/selenodomain-associated transferase 2
LLLESAKKAISVVIPVAEQDELWEELLPDLTGLDTGDEILLVSETSLQSELEQVAKRAELPCPVRWIYSAPGRAKQLNSGARAARSDFLWFLHCDSKIERASVSKLKKTIEQDSTRLYFFDLNFLNDGPWMMILNRVGVWFRSRLLGLPFGDQAFCMHRDVFNYLGGFCEVAPYGEDHLLIWRAHQKGVKVRSVRAPISTSARRYGVQGWSKTTVRHLRLTARQAIPELMILLRGEKIS